MTENIQFQINKFLVMRTFNNIIHNIMRTFPNFYWYHFPNCS